MSTAARPSFLLGLYDGVDSHMEGVITCLILTTLVRYLARGVKIPRETLDALEHAFTHEYTSGRTDILPDDFFSNSSLKSHFSTLFLNTTYPFSKNTTDEQMRGLMTAAFQTVLKCERWRWLMPSVCDCVFSRYGMRFKVVFPGETREEFVTLPKVLSTGILKAEQFSPERVFWTWTWSSIVFLQKALEKDGVTLDEWLSARMCSTVEQIMYTDALSTREKVDTITKYHFATPGPHMIFFGNLFTLSPQQPVEFVSPHDCKNTALVLTELAVECHNSSGAAYFAARTFIHMLLRGLLTRPSVGLGRFQGSFMDHCELEHFAAMHYRHRSSLNPFCYLLTVPILRFKLRVLFSAGGRWGGLPNEIRTMIMRQLYETHGVLFALECRFCFCGRTRGCCSPCKCRVLSHM